MQLFRILLAFLGDFTRNGLIVSNLIQIIPGILECKSNQIFFFRFSSNIKIIHKIKIYIKNYAKLHF